MTGPQSVHPPVVVDRATKRFRQGDSTVEAIRDVSLSIEDGEVSVLLGASGCGKTSLLRIIAGLEAPSSGAVTLNGERIVGPHPSIGLVFQEPRLMPWLTAAQNVGFGLHTIGAHDRKIRTDELLDRLGLGGQHGKLPRDLSGGQ